VAEICARANRLYLYGAISRRWLYRGRKFGLSCVCARLANLSTRDRILDLIELRRGRKIPKRIVWLPKNTVLQIIFSRFLNGSGARDGFEPVVLHNRSLGWEKQQAESLSDCAMRRMPAGFKANWRAGPLFYGAQNQLILPVVLKSYTLVQVQLLHSPIRQLPDDKLVRAATVYLVYGSELLRLRPGSPEFANDSSVQLHFVNLAVLIVRWIIRIRAV